LEIGFFTPISITNLNNSNIIYELQNSKKGLKRLQNSEDYLGETGKGLILL
jgi:hypothetical protein